MEGTKRKDFLWIIFFLIIFINGFEAGGYQASLFEIGKTYELSTASKGIFASVELFATMLAPLLLGAWADHNNKLSCIKILLAIQLVAAGWILLLTSRTVFIGGVFFLGLTTSALQFITIAALADCYPLSSKKKIGYLTSMYAFGAFVAPLVVSAYMNRGFNWRTLFMLLMVTSTVAFVLLAFAGDGKVESLPEKELSETEKGKFIFASVLMLCVVMCIYVGYENGFAFFVDTLFAEEFNSSIGKYALSLFWIIMIPSRICVGYFSKYSRKILLASVVAIPVITIIIAQLNSDIMVMVFCIPLSFACGAIYPCSLNLAMPLAGDKKATATGMITTATGVGGVVFTALTGIMGEKFGLRMAVMALSAFFVVSFIAVVNLKKEGGS